MSTPNMYPRILEAIVVDKDTASPSVKVTASVFYGNGNVDFLYPVVVKRGSLENMESVDLVGLKDRIKAAGIQNMLLTPPLRLHQQTEVSTSTNITTVVTNLINFASSTELVASNQVYDIILLAVGVETGTAVEKYGFDFALVKDAPTVTQSNLFIRQP